MALHDPSYRLLFSHPEMVRDLLQGFVPESWLAQVDYASLERLSDSYVSSTLRARASDTVWRLKWHERWIYLLIEFQSTIEPYMAVRILTYVGLLYEELLKGAQRVAGELLPQVLPIVLYNGSKRWYPPQESESLIEPGPPGLESYWPRIRYLLIDEGEYRDSALAGQRNLVAVLFRLENSASIARIEEALGQLIECLRSPEQEGLRRAFGVWLNRVILARLPGGAVNEVRDLQEMRTMLAERLEEWYEETKREAMREGLREGREQGAREGEARLLLRLLRKRYGELPEAVVATVMQAEPAQLEHWAERALEISSLEALFNSPWSREDA